MSFPFHDKVAIVTGGGRGIGAAYCEALAQHGATVVVADIDPKASQETATTIVKDGGDAHALRLDVGSEESVRQAIKHIDARYGKVDFLINNAAIVLDVKKPFKPFWEIEWEEWARVMAVNAGGIYLCCKYVKPIMEKQGGGRIVNIGSDSIWKGYESQLAYFASKGAVAVMTRCLARELGPFNINVNCLAPGLTLSDSTIQSPDMQRVKPLVIASQCIKREQMPRDLVGTVLFLCSDASANITGQTIVVNLGAIMP